MRKIIVGILLLVIGFGLMFWHNDFSGDMNVSEESYVSVREIDVDEFAGIVEIVKSDENYIKASKNVSVVDLNGVLKVSSKRRIFNFKKNDKITIGYTAEMMDVFLNDFAGKAYIEMPDDSYLRIEDIAGKVEVKTNGSIDVINSEDVLGRVKLNGVSQDFNSKQKIEINDVAGEISIY